MIFGIKSQLTFSKSQPSSQTGPLIPVLGLIVKTLPSFELDPPTRYTENKSFKNVYNLFYHFHLLI